MGNSEGDANRALRRRKAMPPMGIPKKAYREFRKHIDEQLADLVARWRHMATPQSLWRSRLPKSNPKGPHPKHPR